MANARDHEDAENKNAHGRDLLDTVEAAKKRALANPFSDKSAANARKAIAEGWQHGDGSREGEKKTT